MRKLYWKIFIWFWVASVLIIIVTALLSSKMTQHSSNNLSDRAFLNTIESAGTVMLQNNQLDQFHSWANGLHSRFGILLFIVPADGIIPHSHTPPDPTLKFLLQRIRQQQPPFKEMRPRSFIITAPIKSISGKHYRIIMKVPAHITEKFNFSWVNITVYFLIAIFISGFICYLLSLYLSRPIRVLQRAARRLGRGDFDTRVSKELHLRKDEISELALEFDDMASRIQSLMHTRQQLLQDISHELRSPLARLSVALEIARTKDNKEHPELARIELESNRLNELIRRILSLASLNIDDQDVQFEMTNLNQLIQSVVDDANYEAQSKSTQIRLSAEKQFDLMLNQPLISSAIENVIRNALRYSPDESSIDIQLTQSENKIVITIQDAGPGIPEQSIHYIFEPFYRVDASRTTKTGGYGLGLAIAKKAIALHKGTITAENIPEGGLKVTIRLPLIGAAS